MHASIVREVDRRLGDAHGVSVRWYDVLSTLDEAPGRQLRMSALAENVVLSPSRLTRVVERLEQVGLVERRTDERDARASNAVLTEVGLRTLRRARRMHHEIVRRRFLSLLSQAEMRQLGMLWREILERGTVD